MNVGALPAPLSIPWRSLLTAVGVALLALFWIDKGLLHPHLDSDGAAYWSIRDGVLYEYRWLSELDGQPHPYVYSPAFAQALWPFVQLPLAVFMAVLVAVQLGALAWLVGPLAAALLVWFVPAVGLTNVWAGSMYPLMALALALSLRYPGMWAFQVLTKVTPGVGIVWHIARREWRALGWAVGTTALIVAVSALLWPTAWVEWVNVLRDGAGRSAPGALAVPLTLRLPLAAIVVAVAGWRDWRWLLPVGVMLAMPQVGWSTAVILLASVYWWRTSRGTPLRTP